MDGLAYEGQVAHRQKVVGVSVFTHKYVIVEAGKVIGLPV
jgi:hypothetical protein